MTRLIRILVVDVDGTLTDGSIIYGNSDLEYKTFSVKDGLILKILNQFGIDVLFLTGRNSEAANRRADELNCKLIENAADKRLVLSEYLEKNDYEWAETAYIGDDLNDYKAMLGCGFRACPSDAVNEIKLICDYISPIAGGKGAVRDICEQLLKKQNKWEQFLEYWQKRSLLEE